MDSTHLYFKNIFVKSSIDTIKEPFGSVPIVAFEEQLKVIYNDQQNIVPSFSITLDEFVALGQSIYENLKYCPDTTWETIFSALWDNVLEKAPLNKNLVQPSVPDSHGIDHANAYSGGQNPVERLRNMLTPFTTLVQLLKESTQPPVDLAEEIKPIYEKCLNNCNDSLHKVQFYLNDVERFYGKK